MSKFNTELQIQIEYTYFMRVKKRNPTRFPSQNVRTTWDDIETRKTITKIYLYIEYNWLMLSKKWLNITDRTWTNLMWILNSGIQERSPNRKAWKSNFINATVHLKSYNNAQTTPTFKEHSVPRKFLRSKFS